MEAIFSLIRSNLRTIFCLFLVGIVYVYTLAPSISPQGDSGELVSVAYFLGIAHPPGYPLYTLLGHLFSLIPLNSVAWRLNLFAAFSHLGTLLFIYLIVFHITKKWLVAMGTTFILAFSYTFWLYSLIAEVFSLNNLVVTAMLYVVVIQKNFFWLALLFGLGLSNHHSVVLLIPALFYYLYPLLSKQKISFWLYCLGFLALGLTSYFYIIWRAKTAIIPVAWSYPTDFVSLVRMFLRADYGSTVPYQGAQPALATLAQKFGQIVTYFRLFWDDFLVFGAVLFLIGVIAGFLKRRRLTLFLLIGFATNLFFLSYANFPINEFSGTTLAITERFYLLGNIFAALIIGLGLEAIYIIFTRIKVLRLLSLPLIIFIVVFVFVRNYQSVSQRGNYLGRDLARNVLLSAPKNSFIIPGGDVLIFLTMYERYVEGFRPDVDLWTGNQAGPENNYRYLRKTRPDLDFTMPEAVTMAGVVRLNFAKIPVLTTDQPPFKVKGLISSPSGFLYFFQKESGVRQFEVWRKMTDENLRSYFLPTQNDILIRNTVGDRVVMGSYVSLHINLGDYCRINQRWDCAVEYFKKALFFDPHTSVARSLLANTYSQMKDCARAEQEYFSLLKENPLAYEIVYADLAKLAKDCWNDADKINLYKRKEINDLRAL